jgi:PEP-CTERM motif
MKKAFGIVVGLAGLLAAGSANAGTIYDTITGYTSTGALKLAVANNHDPSGVEFNVASSTFLTSVEVALGTTVASGGSTNDGGSVLVYLVPDNSGAPSATGLTLTSPTYVGTILDSSLVAGTITDLSVAPSGPIALAAGNYWLELTSSADSNNYHGTVNTHPTSATWSYFPISSVVGPTVGSISSLAQSPGVINTVSTANPAFPYVFQASIQTAPEPTTVALLGIGLLGLGLGKRFRSKGTSV